MARRGPMADSTTFHGDNAPYLVLEPPRRRRGERSDIGALRERVRDLGADLRRNWNDAQPDVAQAQPSRRSMSQAPEPSAPDAREMVAVAPAEGAWRAFATRAARSVPGVLFARRGLALKSLLGVLLALATVGLLRDMPGAVETPVTPPVAPAAWIDIAKPYPLFELVAPSLGHGQPVYTARRHAQGGGREDVLTFGLFGGPKPFVRIGVYRHGGEEVADAVYFVDMARRASASGLGVTQADLPLALPTRFGAFESGALELSGPENSRRANCRGFRLDVASPGLTMGGLMCGAGDEKFSAADLACLIDRLDLVAAGQDSELADFFGAAGSRKSRACADTVRRK